MRRNLFRLTAVLLLPILFLPSTGCSQAKTPGFDSPRAAFETAKELVKQGNWKGFCKCITNESRDSLVVCFVAGAVIVGLEPAPEDAAAAAEIDKIMKKHGFLDLNELENKPVNHASADPTKENSSDFDDPDEMAREAIEPIKDRNQFIADMAPLVAPLMTKTTDALFHLIEPGDALVDLNFAGDGATGVIVWKEQDRVNRLPIEFKTGADGWKIQFPNLNPFD